MLHYNIIITIMIVFLMQCSYIFCYNSKFVVDGED